MFNRVMTKDNIAVVTLLEHRASGARLIVANAHITWEPQFRDVKLVQVAMLMEELNKISNDFARLPARMNLAEGYDKAPHYSSGAKIPTIICGDFNSEPDSGVYEFLSTGHVEKNHGDFMDHVYGDYAVKGASHGFKLKSAYSHVNELPFTNFTPGFTGESFVFSARGFPFSSPLLTRTDSFPLLRHDRLCLVYGPVTRSAGFARRPRPRLSLDHRRVPELPLPV
jgi:CCR4-NOT transcription complex subunit 6